MPDISRVSDVDRPWHGWLESLPVSDREFESLNEACERIARERVRDALLRARRTRFDLPKILLAAPLAWYYGNELSSRSPILNHRSRTLSHSRILGLDALIVGVLLGLLIALVILSIDAHTARKGPAVPRLPLGGLDWKAHERSSRALGVGLFARGTAALALGIFSTIELSPGTETASRLALGGGALTIAIAAMIDIKFGLSTSTPAALDSITESLIYVTYAVTQIRLTSQEDLRVRWRKRAVADLHHAASIARPAFQQLAASGGYRGKAARKQSRKLADRFTAGLDTHLWPVATEHDATRLRRVEESLCSGMVACVKIDLAHITKHPPPSREATWRAWFRRLAPACLLIAGAFTLPLIPEIASNQQAANSLQITLIISGLLALAVPDRGLASASARITSVVDDALKP
jgi:hypothetical protein